LVAFGTLFSSSPTCAQLAIFHPWKIALHLGLEHRQRHPEGFARAVSEVLVHALVEERNAGFYKTRILASPTDTLFTAALRQLPGLARCLRSSRRCVAPTICGR
jgi:hypothetical protein